VSDSTQIGGIGLGKDTRGLLADVAGGDMDAFGQLYDSLCGHVLNYARTITRSTEMAEDITHDVFLQVLKHAARIAKVDDPVAYIMVATRNHAYNTLKRERPLTDLPDEIPETCAAPSAHDQLLFKDAFDALPASQREAAYLHLICGYAHKEIAGIQNVPLVTVKWRYGRALSKLRGYFSQNENEEVKCNEHI
jgi:RNA polymerase sigma-70 factor (ECF subfamily)